MEYSRLSGDELVTLRALPSTEAEMARAKLEAEGIACCVVGGALAGTHPLLFTEVKLQVRQEDKQRAESILASPAKADAQGEYVEEDWRCPRCHKKALEILPLKPGQARLRTGCLTFLFLPLLVMATVQIVQSAELGEWVEDNRGLMAAIWGVVVIVLCTATLLIRREKRCTECSWRSDSAK